MSKQTHRIVRPDGVQLVVEMQGNKRDPAVIFLHGGGQTRRSWKGSLDAVAALGYYAVAYDARGHGESAHSPDGNYQLELMAEDLADVVAYIGGAPILIGASLGGLTALTYAGLMPNTSVRGIALVDISMQANQSERERIMDFMSSGTNGFNTLDEAVVALQKYNPHRPKPSDLSGLKKVFRERDGKYFWHWDPKFISSRRGEVAGEAQMLEEAGRNLKMPVLLIHAGRSAFITEKELKHLRDVIPHADYTRVEEAGHMVAGDANDAFNASVIRFLEKVDGPSQPPARQDISL